MFHDVTFREAGVDIEKKRFPSALTPADQRFDLLKTMSSTSWYLLRREDHLQIESKEKSEWFASQHSCHHAGNEDKRYSGKGVT